jgi:hypothetical protein
VEGRTVRRNAIVRKSPLTSHDIAERTKERDAEPVFDRLPCGCAWWSDKAGTSRWEHTAECGPWPKAYRSKAKYLRAT